MSSVVDVEAVLSTAGMDIYMADTFHHDGADGGGDKHYGAPIFVNLYYYSLLKTLAKVTLFLCDRPGQSLQKMRRFVKQSLFYGARQPAQRA
jgi:hypothetical protein